MMARTSARTTVSCWIADPSTAADYGQDVVGSRVAIRWMGDRGQPWFKGKVMDYNPTAETHLVLYEDGDQRSHRLAAEEELGQLRWVNHRS